MTDSDTGDKNETDKEPYSDDSRELGRLERWLSGLLGVTLGIGGVGAVFLSSNQAGTAALVIVSGILLFLAATGTPIKRAKYGDKEIEFARRRIGKALAEAVKDEPEEIAERTAEALDVVDPLAAQQIRMSNNFAQITAQTYERRVKAAILNLLSDDESLEEVRRDGPIDFMLYREDRAIPIEIKFRFPSRRIALRDAYEILGHVSTSKIFDKYILVSNVPIMSAAATLLDGTKVKFVLWTGSGDDDALARALDIGPQRGTHTSTRP